jgi:hypothetical protein
MGAQAAGRRLPPRRVAVEEYARLEGSSSSHYRERRAVSEFEKPNEATSAAEIGPTIAARLADGPLKGDSMEVEVLEGRPPKTIDVVADDGSLCRYCLDRWVQTGQSAIYTFLYRV